MADADLRHWKGQAVRQMARYLKLHNDAYPDVGWGKSWDSCVEDALKELGVKHEDVDSAILADPERPSRKP